MDVIAFADGEKIGILENGSVTYFESEIIVKYREYLLTRERNDEWKFGGEGARFRGDYDFFRAGRNAVCASVNGLSFWEHSLLYSYSVNGASGVYRKELHAENARESHVFSTSEEDILSVHGLKDRLAVTVQGREPSSSVGILDLKTSELKTYTSGDSLDKNPFLYGNEIYFDTAGLGRDAHAEFTGKYAPAEICRLNLGTLEIEELKKDGKFDFIKPKISPDGALCYIRRPAREKRSNPFLEMLLIPVRIFQALVLFIQSFVISWTGKSLTAGAENPARGREKKSNEIFVEGNLIEADKELRRSRKAKDGTGGFIPRSWKLVESRDGKEKVLKEGVCDYCFVDGGIVVTNGKHLLLLKDGTCRKLVDTENCLCVCSDLKREDCAAEESDLFGL